MLVHVPSSNARSLTAKAPGVREKSRNLKQTGDPPFTFTHKIIWKLYKIEKKSFVQLL